MGKPAKHTLQLRMVPEDVRKEILEMQVYMKMKCSCNFSLEKTVYKIIRNWHRVKNISQNGVLMTKIAEDLSTPKES